MNQFNVIRFIVGCSFVLMLPFAILYIGFDVAKKYIEFVMHEGFK